MSTYTGETTPTVRRTKYTAIRSEIVGIRDTTRSGATLFWIAALVFACISAAPPAGWSGAVFTVLFSIALTIAAILTIISMAARLIGLAVDDITTR